MRTIVDALRNSCRSRFRYYQQRTVLLLSTCVFSLVVHGYGQPSVLTSRNDNARTGLNANETLLTPANVNQNSFSFLFSQSVDGYIVGQPLYVPNVGTPGTAVTHNVVYVTTLHDSVYAFDADNNVGINSAPLWQVNFTNPADGVTTASGSLLPCQTVTSFPEAGIVSTPVIDSNTATLYVVAKTAENGTVAHRLHALDIVTGEQKASTLITATFTAKSGKVSTSTVFIR
jgi:glucose dehydrogenase